MMSDEDKRIAGFWAFVALVLIWIGAAMIYAPLGPLVVGTLIWINLSFADMGAT